MLISALVISNKPVDIEIGNYTIDNSKCKKLLPVRIDVDLSFNNHISNLCKKASRKISALARSMARFTSFMRLGKRILLTNAFFTSSFSYYPLIWMYQNRKNDRKTNMLHEKCLTIIDDDRQSSFTELLNKGSSVLIHRTNIQRYAIKMLKDYHRR